MRRLKMRSTRLNPVIIMLILLGSLLFTGINENLYDLNNYNDNEDLLPPISTPNDLNEVYNEGSVIESTIREGFVPSEGVVPQRNIIGTFMDLDSVPPSDWQDSQTVKVDYNAKNNTVKSLDFARRAEYRFNSTFGSSGSGDGQFSFPYYLTDDEGDILVADRANNRIQRLSRDGVYISKFGSSGSGDGQFSAPNGIGVDSLGNIYVADVGNNRIQKFTTTGEYILQWAVTNPTGLAIDEIDNVYTLSSTTVRKYDSAGTFLISWGSTGTGNGQFQSGVSGLTIDNEGYVVVADTFNDRIQKFTPLGTYISKFGTFGTGDGQFDSPFGVTVDSDGYIYVLDTANDRVQKIDPDYSTYITQFAGFSSPRGLILNQLHNMLYVASSFSHNVFIFIFDQPIDETVDFVGELPIIDDDEFFFLQTDHTTSLATETIHVGFTYFDLNNPTTLGITFDWIGHPSYFGGESEEIFKDESLTLSISNLAVYSSSELRVYISFVYTTTDFTVNMSTFDTGTNTIIDSSVVSGLSYEAFAYTTINIDYVWAESQEIASNVRSDLKYSSPTQTIHLVEVDIFEYRIPLDVYTPLTWNFSSIVPSATVTWDDTNKYYHISNTIPTTYSITFISGQGWGIGSSYNSTIAPLTDVTDDFLSCNSFECGNVTADLTYSVENNDVIWSANTSIVSDGAVSLRMENDESTSEGFYIHVNKRGAYTITFDTYVESGYTWDYIKLYYRSNIGTWGSYQVDDIVPDRWQKHTVNFTLSGIAVDSWDIIIVFVNGQGVAFIDNIHFWELIPTIRSTSDSSYDFTVPVRIIDGYFNPNINNHPFVVQLKTHEPETIIQTWNINSDNGLLSFTYPDRLFEQGYVLTFNSTIYNVTISDYFFTPLQASHYLTNENYDVDFDDVSFSKLIDLDADTETLINGTLDITSTGSDYWAYYSSSGIQTAYSVSTRIKYTGGADKYIGISFFDIPTSSSASDDMFMLRSGTAQTIFRVGGIETNPVFVSSVDTWYIIRADVTTDQVKIYIDNQLVATRINTNLLINPYFSVYGMDSNAQVDFVRISILTSPTLFTGETETYATSTNNTLINAVYSDGNYLGLYNDLSMIALNLTSTSHNITVMAVINSQLSNYVFFVDYTNKITYSYDGSAEFQVSVSTFTVADVIISTFIISTKNGNYTVYENDTSQGTGNFVGSGTSIQSNKNAQEGIFVNYAIAFQNNNDVVWFNTTYSNVATPPVGEVPVFFGTWYYGETINVITTGNDIQARSYYRYITGTLIEHVVWIVPQTYNDWVEFKLPMSWSSVTLAVDVTLISSTNNNYQYSPAYAGTDYVLTAFSGAGYGYDYERQKQILALEDISSVYFDYPGFESGTDAYQNVGYEYDTFELDTTIVFDGTYSLHLADGNSGDRDIVHFLYQIENNVLIDSNLYISFSYYRASVDTINFYYKSTDAWTSVILDGEQDRWTTVFFYVEELARFRFDTGDNQAPDYYFDTIKLMKASGSVETVGYTEYEFSASFISWDGYQNPEWGNKEVEWSLRDRTEDTEIISKSLITDEYGIASYTFKGTLEQKEYENRWFSWDSWWGTPQSITETETDFSDFSDFTGTLTQSSDSKHGSYSANIESSNLVFNLNNVNDYDLRHVDYISFWVKSNVTITTNQIFYLYAPDSANRYSLDLHFISGGDITADVWKQYSFNLYELGITGSPDLSQVNYYRFNFYTGAISYYIDAFHNIQPQKSYFTPISAGYTPYSYETKTDGSENYWDFTENTLDGLNWRIVGDLYNEQVTNGYVNFDVDLQWRGVASDNPLTTSIDTNIYNQAIIRFKGNISDTSLFLYYTVDSTSYYATHINTTADVWQTYVVDLVAGDLTYFRFETRYIPTAMTNIQIDYIYFVDKSYNNGHSWEFEEPFGDVSVDGFNGWTTYYGGVRENVIVENGYLDLNITNIYGGISRFLDNPQTISTTIALEIKIKIISSGTMSIYLKYQGVVFKYLHLSAMTLISTDNDGFSVYRYYHISEQLIDNIGISDQGFGIYHYQFDYIRFITDTSNPPLETDTYFQISSDINEQYAVWLDNVYLGINNATSIILKNNTLGNHTLEYTLYKDTSNDYSPQVAALIQRYSYTVIDEGNMYVRFQNGIGQYIPFESFTSYYRFNSDPYVALAENIIHFDEITYTVDIFINDTYGNTVANKVDVPYNIFHTIIIDSHEIFFSNQVNQSLLVQLKMPSASWSESVGYWIGLDSFRAITLYNGTYDYRVLASDGATVLLASTPLDVDNDMAIELSEESDLGIYSYNWSVGNYNTTLTVVTNYGDAIIRVWDESGYLGEWTETGNIIWEIPTGLDQSTVTFYVMREVQKYGVLENQTLIRTFTYSITGSEGQPPVFIGTWFEGESIHLVSQSNNYDIKSYYTYTTEFTIKHMIWVVPTNNLQWLEFSLPMHWSNVSLNIVTTLGSSTNNNYNYTAIYGGADYILTAYSGVGYGSDYIRQKQILAIEDVTLDYIQSPGFESGTNEDWEERPSYLFDSISINTSIVYDGSFSLRLSDNDVSHHKLQTTFAFDSGYYYYSASIYIEAFSGTDLYFQNYNGSSWNTVSIDTTLINRWQTIFWYAQIEDTDTADNTMLIFDSASGVVFLDNFKIWKASGSVETIGYQQYEFSASFLTWDGYLNLLLPHIDVEWSLRDRTADTEIISKTLTTNEFGIASYTFKGTLEMKEYENRWWSNDNWFGDFFTDTGLGSQNFDNDIGSWAAENVNLAITHDSSEGALKISYVSSTWGGFKRSITVNENYNQLIFRGKTDVDEYLGSIWDYDDQTLDAGDYDFTSNYQVYYSLEFSNWNSSDTGIRIMFGGYGSGDDTWIDYIKLINPNSFYQNTYFTPIPSSDLPYYYETKTDGSDNYWDFSEGTIEDTTTTVGSVFDTKNGYLNISDTATMTAFFGGTNLDIDASFYDTLQIRVYTPNIAGSNLRFFTDTGQQIGSDVSISSNNTWEVFEIDLSADADWTGTETYLEFWVGDVTGLTTIIYFDYIHLVHKTLDTGHSWEFEEPNQTMDDFDTDFVDWTDLYGATTEITTNGLLEMSASAGTTSGYKIISDFEGITLLQLEFASTDNSLIFQVYDGGGIYGGWTTLLTLTEANKYYIINIPINPSVGGFLSFRVENTATTETHSLKYFRSINAVTSNPPLETDSYFQISTDDGEQYAVWLDNIYLGINYATSIILKNNTLGNHTFEYALYKDNNNDYSPQLTALIQRYSYTVVDEGNMYVRFQNGIGQYVPFEAFTSYYRFNSDPYSALGDNIVHFDLVTSTVDIFINDTYGNTVANEVGVEFDNFHIIIIDSHEVFFSNQVAQSLLIQLKMPSASWSESVGYWIGLDSFRAITLYNGTYDYRVLASDGSTILLASTPLDVDRDIAIELSEETNLGIYSYTWGVGTYNATLTVVTNHGDAIIRVWDESGYLGEWIETDNIIWEVPTGIDQSVVIFYVMKEVQKYGVLVNQTLSRTYTYPIGFDLGILQTDVRFFELDADTYAVEASSNHANTTIVITHDGVVADNETLGVYGLFGITKATAGGFHNVTVIISWTNSTGSTFTNTYIFDYWVDNYYSATYEVIPNSPGLKIASNEISMRSFNVYVDEVLITPILPDDLRQQTTANINYTVIYDGYLFIRSTTYLHNITIKDKWDYPLFHNETDMREYTHLVIELPLVRATFVSERDEDVEVDMYLFNITSGEYEPSGSVSVAAGQIVDGVWVIGGQYAIRVWGVTTDEVLINSKTTTVQIFAEDVEYSEGNKEDFGGLGGDGVNATLCAINPSSCGIQYGYKIFKLKKYSYSSESSTDPFSDLGWLETAQTWIIQVWTDYKYWIIGVVVVLVSAFILFGNLTSLKNLTKKKKVKIEKTTKLPTPRQRREGEAGLPVYSKNKPPQKSSLPMVTSRKKRKLPNR